MAPAEVDPMAAIEALLDVIDSCDRAVALSGVSDDDSTTAGIRMILERAVSSAERINLISVYPEGERFTPTEHEAVSTRPGGEHGQVCDVVRRGWKLNGASLRVAQVTVYDGSGCPHGRPNADGCLQCFRAVRPSPETARRGS